MVEEVSSTVKSSSDGTVKITVERYQELLEKSAEKPAIIHRNIVKTKEMAAKDNQAWGITFMGFGAAAFIIGAFRLRLGMSQAAELLKQKGS